MTMVKAHLNNYRTSPRKVSLVAQQLRGKSLSDALGILDYDIRKSGEPIAKLIRSAQANAINNFKLNEKDLIVEDVIVGAGPTLKRWRPRAYGRASKIMKRTSRITVILSDGSEDQPEKPEQKKETAKKTTEKKATKKAVKKEAKAVKKSEKKTETKKKTATTKKQ